MQSIELPTPAARAYSVRFDAGRASLNAVAALARRLGLSRA